MSLSRDEMGKISVFAYNMGVKYMQKNTAYIEEQLSNILYEGINDERWIKAMNLFMKNFKEGIMQEL